MPDISILVPVWNGLPYLEECISSILRQKDAHFEVIVSDDCSNDDSINIIKSLKDHRIKVFSQDVNLGIFGNINFMIDQAKSPICVFLCQDDHFTERDSVAHLVRLWGTLDDKVGVVRSNWREGIWTGTEVRFGSLPRRVRSEDSALFFFLYGCLLGNLSNVSFRREAIINAGYFDQTFPYAGDFDMWVRLCSRVDVVIDEKNITRVRDHENQASFLLNKRGELVIQLYKIFDRLYAKLRKYNGFLLKLYFSIAVDSQHGWVALRRLIWFGDGGSYFSQWKCARHHAEEVTFSMSFRLLIVVATLGGRVWRKLLGIYLLRRILAFLNS